MSINGTFRLSAEAKLILGALPRATGRIGVVYAHGPLYPAELDADPGMPNGKVAVGFAVGAYAFTAAEDAGCLGGIFISSTEPAYLFALAHEAGHILINFGHSFLTENLMNETGTHSKDAKGPKRLSEWQTGRIKGSLYSR